MRLVRHAFRLNKGVPIQLLASPRVEAREKSGFVFQAELAHFNERHFDFYHSSNLYFEPKGWGLDHSLLGNQRDLRRRTRGIFFPLIMK